MSPAQLERDLRQKELSPDQGCFRVFERDWIMQESFKVDSVFDGFAQRFAEIVQRTIASMKEVTKSFRNEGESNHNCY
jgi:hypothetical protein